ncbi:MAG TPA: hypothetical protein VFP84_31050 [Kofleriaceae bacterium]|nr:hypothetical protein [Kofleriaceae bacterium]
MSRCASGLPAFIALTVACGKPSPGPGGAAGSDPWSKPPAAAPAGGGSAGACEALPFAESTPVPEASAAAWLTVNGRAVLVVVGDSGNHGAYGLVDAESGATLETGQLPLGDAGDDLEGVATIGDTLYGLTSSGWMRQWRRTPAGGGFELVGAAYPIGPVDLPDTRNDDRPPRSDGMVCGPRAGNCGRNYEGLCLVPTPVAPGACQGFAAAKADGHLYCLVADPSKDHGALAVDRTRAIAVSKPSALADCAFAADGSLWAGDNLFGFGRIYRIARWQDPATAQVESLGVLSVGFPEVIAVRGDVVYRMSDLGRAPSLMARYRCKFPPKE